MQEFLVVDVLKEEIQTSRQTRHSVAVVNTSASGVPENIEIS
ncbi:MAG: hypothetical protein AAF478_05410 [Pseudomonadota bacterium]